MKIMFETTKWPEGQSGNHVYVFTKYHPAERQTFAVAYVPNGSKTLQKFKKPLQIDLRGRTFEELK